MNVIAIANTKGGQGKTATAVNLAAAYAIAGRRVLVIDMGPQFDATTNLADPEKEIGQGTTAHVLVGKAPLRDVIRPSNRYGVDLAPGNKEMTGAQMAIVSKMGRELILRRQLESIEDYDLTFIDTGPEQQLATINALVAATHLLIPFNADPNALKGIRAMMDAVATMDEAGLPAPKVLGSVQVAYDRRINACKQVRDRARKRYPGLVVDTLIRTNTNFVVLPSWRMDIFAYEEKHSRDARGSKDFAALATELDIRMNIISPANTVAA